MSATAGHFIGETHTRSERVGCTNHGELRRMAHISCTAQPSPAAAIVCAATCIH